MATEESNKSTENIKVSKNDISVDYDSDSDDGFSVVKKHNNNSTDPLKEQTDCVRDILEAILAIPSLNKSFIDHIKSHNTLIADLLKTHLTSTNDIHLLSLLYFCIDLLLQNKSEIGLLCFNRITALSLNYDSQSINKKSLRLLTKMATVYGAHLLALVYKPLKQHLSVTDHNSEMEYTNDNSELDRLLRSGSVLQIAKLYNISAENRAKIDTEWASKQILFDILRDRDNDKNMHIYTINNTLITLSEMCAINKCKNIIKYCQISSKIQMIIIDKLMHIINDSNNASNTIGIDMILEHLSTHLLNKGLSIAYVFSIAQQMQIFIKCKLKMDNIQFVSAMMSAIKALIKCLRIIERKECPKNESEISEYIGCIGFGVTELAYHCQIHKKYELLWSLLSDIQIILGKYGQRIVKEWTSQQIIHSFGLIFNERNYVKQSKLKMLCKIIEIIYKFDMKQCIVIIAALNSYLLDCVCPIIIQSITDNICQTITNITLHSNSDNKHAIINRLFGVITENTLQLLRDSDSHQLFIIKYSHFAIAIKKVLIIFNKNPKFKTVNHKKYEFLSVDYQRNLVHSLVAFYLKFNSKFDINFVNSMIYLTGEYCQFLENNQMFNVFNFILPSFETEPNMIQLSVLTAITKIYLKINDESKAKIKPLLTHIFQLCTNATHSVNLDVRCRATMYQRLIKYDINAAKTIVLGTNIINTCEQKQSENSNKSDINYRIDHDLCRVSGIYNKRESEFMDSSMYVALEESDSECYSESESVTEYHSSEDDLSENETENSESELSDNGNDNDTDSESEYKLIVDTSVGQGVEVKMRIDPLLKHKIIFLITNKTIRDIYQIDLKFNKNYLGIQSLKTLLNNDEIIGVHKTKKIIVPLILTEKSHQKIAIQKCDSMRLQTAIRFFQKNSEKQSKVIFFNVCVPFWLFFNEFKDNTANNNYTNKVQTMKCVSRKCQIEIRVKDSDSTEEIIDSVLTKQLLCKKIKELKQESEKRIIYMALLQFKWILIGVCVHKSVIKGKRKYKSKTIMVDIITKSNTVWQSEATMQSAKFAILSERHFLGSIK